MNVLALVCTKCGGPLNFNGSLVCECSACKTPHALVSSQGDLDLPVSYMPYVQSSDGKMQKSLKIRLAEKIRGETSGKFVVAERYYSDSNFDRDYLEVIEGKVVYDQKVVDNSNPLVVGVTKITEVKFFNKVIYQTSIVDEICLVMIIPVKVNLDGNKILAGHRILIGVFHSYFEEDANRFSKLVQDWFGIVPEVNLQQG